MMTSCQILGQIPIHHNLQTSFFVFQNFKFFTFFFSFSLTWDHMGEKFQTTSPLKVHIRFAPQKIMHTIGRVSTKVVQRIIKFQILDFHQFFSFSLTWNHMTVKVSNDISERTHQIGSPKLMYMYTPGEGLYQSC